jgi:hypothetical protein
MARFSSKFGESTGDLERLVVRPRRACHLLDCGITRLYELLRDGELESFLDGRSRKITVDSIRRYVDRGRGAGQPAKDQPSAGSVRSAAVPTPKTAAALKRRTGDKPALSQEGFTSKETGDSKVSP